ncbi:MAG: hypothetical protein ACYDBH_14875 [Acidobacteriaceae bacterium]
MHFFETSWQTIFARLSPLKMVPLSVGSDVLPTHGEARAHVGTLGIGLLPYATTAASDLSSWRLLFRALGKAVFLVSISWFELAIKMPKRFTSASVSLSKVFYAALHVSMADGEFFDAYAMALVRWHGAQPAGRPNCLRAPAAGYLQRWKSK